MANAELQNLARSYASGKLHRNVYRMQRAEILDAFSSSMTDNPDSPITLRLKKPAGLSLSTKLLSREIWIAAGIVGLILLAGIAFLLYLTKSDVGPDDTRITTPEPSISSPSDSSISDNTTVTQDSNADIAQLAEVIIQGDAWETDRIDNFQQHWLRLNAEEQKLARESTWFNQLKFVLIQRIAKYRAKASLGDKDALKQAESLTSFASHLGIESLK